jgi:hypothetical protein
MSNIIRERRRKLLEAAHLRPAPVYEVRRRCESHYPPTSHSGQPVPSSRDVKAYPLYISKLTVGIFVGVWNILKERYMFFKRKELTRGRGVLKSVGLKLAGTLNIL